MRLNIFTIVLDGSPWIGAQFAELSRIRDFDWHWSIVEGASLPKKDTAWMALRSAGRLAGPVGLAMTAYDLAQAFPAPAPISEKDMGEALRSYRTGPQQDLYGEAPSINYYQPSFSR